jgi:hypothetical protein
MAVFLFPVAAGRERECAAESSDFKDQAADIFYALEDAITALGDVVSAVEDTKNRHEDVISAGEDARSAP